MTKLAVVKADEGWDILVDGNGEIFRRFETEAEVESVAQRWRGILSNVETNGEREGNRANGK